MDLMSCPVVVILRSRTTLVSRPFTFCLSFPSFFLPLCGCPVGSGDRTPVEYGSCPSPRRLRYVLGPLVHPSSSLPSGLGTGSVRPPSPALTRSSVKTGTNETDRWYRLSSRRVPGSHPRTGRDAYESPSAPAPFLTLHDREPRRRGFTVSGDGVYKVTESVQCVGESPGRSTFTH